MQLQSAREQVKVKAIRLCVAQPAPASSVIVALQKVIGSEQALRRLNQAWGF
jgi:hypothetical protein